MSEAFAVDVQDGVIHVSGDLDAQTSAALDEVISAMLADGAQELVFDLAALEFLDSSGLRSMVLARGPQGERPGWLAVVVGVTLVGHHRAVRRVRHRALSSPRSDRRVLVLDDPGGDDAARVQRPVQQDGREQAA